MKTKRYTRLMSAALTVALTLLLCAAAAFTVSADPEDGIETIAVEESDTAIDTSTEAEPPAGSEAPPEPVSPVPDGATPPYHSTGNIIENVRRSSAEDEGLQFVIFKTASDKVFYLVIDYDKGNDNVYLLTEVGENDLLNFVEADKPESPKPPPSSNPGATQLNTEPQPDAPAKKSNNAGLIVLIVAVLGIGGFAFYFFKKNKGGGRPVNIADFDDEDEPVTSENELPVFYDKSEDE